MRRDRQGEQEQQRLPALASRLSIALQSTLQAGLDHADVCPCRWSRIHDATGRDAKARLWIFKLTHYPTPGWLFFCSKAASAEPHFHIELTPAEASGRFPTRASLASAEWHDRFSPVDRDLPQKPSCSNSE